MSAAAISSARMQPVLAEPEPHVSYVTLLTKIEGDR